MTKIRNIILLLVAFVFTFNSFGFIFHYLIEKENAKEEAFEKIVMSKSKEGIETLSISNSVINDGKIFQRINEKEIRYNEKMYDIVKIEKQTDKIIFYCVHDEKEDKLEKDFEKKVNKNFDQETVANSSIIFNHLMQYADYGKMWKIESPIHKVKYSYYLNCNYILNIPIILTPPPKYSLI